MTESVSALQGDCPRCGELARLRARSFSDQAMAALVAWDEVGEAAVSAPLCDMCYEELRDILIDRQEELNAGTTASPQPREQSATKPAKPSAPKTVASKPNKTTTDKKSSSGKTGKKAG